MRSKIQKATLAAIWAEVLSLERVGRHDNFFELGGHSLLTFPAVNLLGRAGMTMLAANVFAHPNLESLAAKIPSESTQGLPYGAIPVKKDGAGPPIFFAHEDGGDLLYVHVLAQHMDAGMPIYGLPPQFPGEFPLRTVEGMAMRMVQMIRAVQPAGPYRVAGWSFGGLLAYEIAAQLIGADEKVEFLGLLDTNAPSGMRDLSGRQLDDGKGPDDGPHAANQGPTPEQLQQRQARSLASLEAGMAYSPEPLPIPVHFFAAQGNDLNFALSWSAVVPESRLRVIPVPGTHNRMMSKPNVATVGHALSHALQNASAKPNEMPEQGYFPLVKLQSGQRNLAPLFCVPGAGANVSCFLELAACLEEAQPVYGLQPRGLDGAMVPHATVAAACEFYLRAIVETCPKGPVHLLGHSFGGWVVFAMAQRLRRAGRVIASLTILDSEIPDDEGAAIREYNNVEAILVWIDIFEKILEHPLGVSRGDIEPRDEAAQRKLLHDRLVSEGLMPRQSDPDRLRGPLQTFARSLRTHYTPSEIYPGPVRLVLVNDQKLDQDANRRNREQVAEGWKRWAPNLVCTCGPGNHLTILNQPHVHVLAGLVREAISDIGREGASKVVMTGD